MFYELIHRLLTYIERGIYAMTAKVRPFSQINWWYNTALTGHSWVARKYLKVDILYFKTFADDAHLHFMIRQDHGVDLHSINQVGVVADQSG